MALQPAGEAAWTLLVTHVCDCGRFHTDDVSMQGFAGPLKEIKP
jgi:hypothetical protein